MQKMIIDNLTKLLSPITFKEFIKYLDFMTEAKIKNNER